MHLKSCCVLFLLALVACQAAPSPKVIEKKSISEAETTFAKNNIQLEDAGAEKDRTKKSATTFCVEVRSGKPEQVPCRQEARPQGIVQQELPKPVYIMQPIPVPAPAPIAQYAAPVPSSQHIAPMPAPAPVQAAPATIPIINIVPPAPAPVPCDKPAIIQPQQPHQIHTVHVIHPQAQPTQRPSVTVIQAKPQKEKPVLKPPRVLPMPNQNIAVVQKNPVCQKCQNENRLPQPMSYFVPPPPAYVDMLPSRVESDKCKVQEEAFECSCHKNRLPPISPNYITSRITKGQEPRIMTYPGTYPGAYPITNPGGATFESMSPYRSSMISTENNPTMMMDQSIFFPSEEANRQMEGRHKKYFPLNLSVQLPIIHPESDNSPKYYESVYRPQSTNPPVSYACPNYGVYGNYGTYGTSYPASYDFQASASSVPSITVNAGGPFHRESQNIDSSSRSNEVEMLPREAISTATEIIDAPNNQKREADIIQLKNEQNEITQEENIINNAIS